MLNDIFTYAAADATLRSLIEGATIAAPRIFPEIAPEGIQGQYVIFGAVKEGSLDEVLDAMTVQFSVFVGEYEQAAADAIIFRLKTLFDKQDQIAIPSTTLKIYWGKHVGGLSDFVTQTREFHRAAMFAFKFKRK